MAFLTRLFARGDFSLPAFELAPLEFDCREGDELLLDQPLAPPQRPSNVVSLRQSSPTAGELRESIERHLEATRGSAAPPAVPDAVDELREALAELRRSLR
jgi:hypothetical protein